MSDEKLAIPIPGREVMRSKGCWNCKNWTADPGMVHPRYRAMRAQATARMKFLPKNALQRISGALPTDPRFFRRVGEAMKAGLTEDAAVRVALAAEQAPGGRTQAQMDKLAFFDDKIRSGKMGLCAIGAAPGDFCEDAFLCHLWSGRDGHSLARIGSQLEDTLPDETRDVVDGRAKKV